MKIPKRLEPLIEEGLIEDVLRPLMSGKEAAVYVVVSGGMLRCAKVYKDAGHRSFRQRVTYTEGRKVRDSRRARAMKRGSRFGQQSAEEDWQNAEVTALNRLYAKGVRVPTPFAFSHGVLIMEMVIGEDGEPAPRLNDISLTEEEALEFHAFLIRQTVWMLCEGLIHGDLSEYNILLSSDGPVIIDLPQAVEAAGNNSAKAMLLRDVNNLRDYFSRYAPSLAGSDYALEIWRYFERGELYPDIPLTGKVAAPTRNADVGSVLSEIDAEREAALGRGRSRARGPSKGSSSGNSKRAEREEARLRGRLDDTWVDTSPPLVDDEPTLPSKRGRRVSEVPPPREPRRRGSKERSSRSRRDGDRPPRRDGDSPRSPRSERPPRRDGDGPHQSRSSRPPRRDGDSPRSSRSSRPPRRDGDGSSAPVGNGRSRRSEPDGNRSSRRSEPDGNRRSRRPEHDGRRRSRRSEPDGNSRSRPSEPDGNRREQSSHGGNSQPSRRGEGPNSNRGPRGRRGGRSSRDGSNPPPSGDRPSPRRRSRRSRESHGSGRKKEEGSKSS